MIREQFTPDFRRLVIDDSRANEAVVDYLKATTPELLPRAANDPMPLFERYHVEDHCGRHSTAGLPAVGRALVIDRTEALTVIDVNTGKFVGTSSLEETVLQNNLEAAEEIGRRSGCATSVGSSSSTSSTWRARPTAGRSRRLKTLAKDRTRTQVFDVSNLGLVEMTRKNVSAGLLETFSEPARRARPGVLLHEEAAVQGVPIAAILEED